MRTSSERPGKIDRVGCAPILGVSPAPHGNGAQTNPNPLALEAPGGVCLDLAMFFELSPGLDQKFEFFEQFLFY